MLVPTRALNRTSLAAPIVNMNETLRNVIVTMTPGSTTPGSLPIAARAAYLLRDNSNGLITKAAPTLYPHQWSWDAAFIAIGLASVAAASDLLAKLAKTLGKTDDAAELKDYAAQARAAVYCHVDEDSGLAADVDLRTGKWLKTETIAGFAPRLAGAMPAAMRSRLVSLLTGERWAGHPSFKFPLPPSTSPCSPAYDPACYWRGPVWPVFTWLLTWALNRSGEHA